MSLQLRPSPGMGLADGPDATRVGTSRQPADCQVPGVKCQVLSIGTRWARSHQPHPPAQRLRPRLEPAALPPVDGLRGDAE